MMSPMRPCRSQEPHRQLINNNAVTGYAMSIAGMVDHWLAG